MLNFAPPIYQETTSTTIESRPNFPIKISLKGRRNHFLVQTYWVCLLVNFNKGTAFSPFCFAPFSNCILCVCKETNCNATPYNTCGFHVSFDPNFCLTVYRVCIYMYYVKPKDNGIRVVPKWTKAFLSLLLHLPVSTAPFFILRCSMLC